MIRLINLELLKLFKKKSIKILFALLFITCILTIYFTNKNNEYNLNDYEYVDNIDDEQLINEYNKEINNKIKIFNYYKENKIDMNLKIKGVMNTGVTIVIFLSVVIILISSTSMTDEINKKSIKELLTKPYKRWKILTAKYISIFTMILFLTLFVYISYVVLTSIIFNTNAFLIKDIEINNGIIKESYYYLTFLKNIFVNSMPLYFISILTIFLTIIFNNSKIISAVIIFLVLMSTLIFQLLLNIDITLIQYTFLPYLDLSIYDEMYSILLLNINYDINLNLNTGKIILLIYGIIFYIFSIIFFNKKDII